jgi:hypothetical protein
VLCCTMAHGLGALAWPSGEFSRTGPCQPAWCGARGTVTAPVMRKVVHPSTAYTWCAELLEHRRRVAYPPGKATRKGALWESGSMRGGRNSPAAVAFVEESDEEGVEGEGVGVARAVLSTTGGGHGRRRCGTHDGGESMTVVSSGAVHREGEKLKLPSLACSPVMRFGR